MHRHIHFSKMIEVLCNTSLIYLLIYLSIYLIMMTTERGGHYRHPRNVLPVTTPYSNSSIYSLTHLITCSIYPSSDWDSAMSKTNLHMLATYGPYDQVAPHGVQLARVLTCGKGDYHQPQPSN